MDKFILAIAFASLLFSCSNQKTTKEQANKNLILKSQFSLPLDSLSGFNANDIQIFEIKGQKKIGLLYRSRNAINIYSFDEKKLEETINFETEGPNGINSLTGFLWISPEEIYVYSYWGRTVYRVNNQSQVLATFQFEEFDKAIKYPVLEPNSLRPMVLRGNQIFIAGHMYQTLPKDQIGTPFVKVNLESKSSELIGKYPDKVFQGKWRIKAQTYFDYLKEKKLFVISYAISDSIEVTDFKKYSKKYEAKSSYIQAIKPFHPNYEYISNNKEEQYAYDLSSAYWGIKYDPYRKVYYRFGIIGNTLEEFSSGLNPIFFVIILDENFTKIGEMKFPRGVVYPSLSFVEKDGLYIANKKQYAEVSEEKLTFNVYLLENSEY